MPGTPTPNLNLAIPTVGGDVNTWGNELNTNLSIIDSMVAAAYNTPSSSIAMSLSPNFITSYAVTTGNTNQTLTLPSLTAASTGRIFVVLKADTGTGFVIIAGTINGSSNYTLVNFSQYVWLIYNGASWNVIGGN